MIYFDNAATTFPKPASVHKAMAEALTRYGGNPGRSGHDLSLGTAQAIFRVRERAARFFSADAENIAFTLNCTHALNLAIKGMMQNGGHIITSDLEHNSVIRPIHALRHTCSYSVAEVSADDAQTVQNFKQLITPQTKAIVCTLASNVTGQALPRREIGALCKASGICFIADGAQACGVLPVDMGKDHINILCMPGHKGLYGPTGTGMLITDGAFELATLLEGGTGSNSLELAQPEFMPDRLESGTPNVPGIIGLGAGMDFVSSIGTGTVYAHELSLCRIFYDRVSKIKNVRLYGGSPEQTSAPILPFNIGDLHSEEATARLNAAGFALRGGLHCSHMAHRKLGTLATGAIRFAPSALNRAEEALALAEAVGKIAKGNK